MKLKNKTKVLLVDKSNIFRGALKVALSRLNYVEIIGELSNRRFLYEYINHNKVDVVIMDVNMNFLNDIETIKVIKLHYPNINVFALSFFSIYKEEIMDAGASGYINKWDFNNKSFSKSLMKVNRLL
jgi:DNA-binding NarL/FixJ family response regulator